MGKHTQELLAAAIRAERALVKMHAQRIWNERYSWDSAKAEEFANNNPLPEVSQLRAAIAKAEGKDDECPACHGDCVDAWPPVGNCPKHQPEGAK